MIGQGAGMVALLPQRIAARIVGVDVVGIEPDRLAATGNGELELAVAEPRRAAMTVRIGEIATRGRLISWPQASMASSPLAAAQAARSSARAAGATSTKDRSKTNRPCMELLPELNHDDRSSAHIITRFTAAPRITPAPAA
jgi:hypothetical protein